MDIRFLGHAGFVVETDSAVIVADPWLSRHGAFASAWMQLPQNHHLAQLVREKLADARKERFVYVSHEHEDHFDRSFLASIPRRDFTAVVPRFRRRKLIEILPPLQGTEVTTRSSKTATNWRSARLGLPGAA